ncbi:MAG: sulfite exporter TauE/SafE family protein, partial [Bacteroidota bacterium]
MIEFIQQQPLTLLGWSGLMLCALFVGMAKTGVAGVYTIIIPIMAFLFGGKESTGVLLPMLVIGDIFAVRYYHRSAAWNHILRLLPWSIGGIVIGTLVGDAISDGAFKALMGVLILIGIAIMLYMEWRKIETV